MMGESGPWPIVLVIILVNVVIALATSQTIELMDIAAVVVMVAGLVTYIGLIGSQGSDIFGVGSTTVAVTRAASLLLFVGAIVAIALGGPSVSGSQADATIATLVFAFINLAMGGFAIFSALAAAKP